MEFVFVFLNAGNGFMGFYGFPGMFYRMDPTYSLVVIGAVICMIASANVNRSFRSEEHTSELSHIEESRMPSSA